MYVISPRNAFGWLTAGERCWLERLLRSDPSRYCCILWFFLKYFAYTIFRPKIPLRMEKIGSFHCVCVCLSNSWLHWKLQMHLKICKMPINLVTKHNPHSSVTQNLSLNWYELIRQNWPQLILFVCTWAHCIRDMYDAHQFKRKFSP